MKESPYPLPAPTEKNVLFQIIYFICMSRLVRTMRDSSEDGSMCTTSNAFHIFIPMRKIPSNLTIRYACEVQPLLAPKGTSRACIAT